MKIDVNQARLVAFFLEDKKDCTEVKWIRIQKVNYREQIKQRWCSPLCFIVARTLIETKPLHRARAASKNSRAREHHHHHHHYHAAAAAKLNDVTSIKRVIIRELRNFCSAQRFQGLNARASSKKEEASQETLTTSPLPFQLLNFEHFPWLDIRYLSSLLRTFVFLKSVLYFLTR